MLNLPCPLSEIPKQVLEVVELLLLGVDLACGLCDCLNELIDALFVGGISFLAVPVLGMCYDKWLDTSSSSY